MLSAIKIIFSFVTLSLSAFVTIPLLQYDLGVDAFTLYPYSLLYITCFALSLYFKNNFAFVAVLIYLCAGILGLPLFAFGAGFDYIFEPSFGYLLGLIPLSILAFYYRFHVPNFRFKTFRDRSLGPLLGLAAAHVFGLIFLLVTGRLNFENFLNMSLYQMIYDFVFGVLLLVLG